MATFQKLRDYIELKVNQNLNYLHIRQVLNDMLDLLAVTTSTYTGGANIEITDKGVINLVADKQTRTQLEEGYADGIAEATSNQTNENG